MLLANSPQVGARAANGERRVFALGHALPPGHHSCEVHRGSCQHMLKMSFLQTHVARAAHITRHRGLGYRPLYSCTPAICPLKRNGLLTLPCLLKGIVLLTHM